MDFLKIPERTLKPRSFGLTSVIDFGTPMGELKHILADYSHIIDIAKMGIGSAYVTPNLKNKILLYQEYGIKPYCGGTFFEKCYYQNKIPEYLKFLHKLGIEWIEVSNGTFDIPLQERLFLISHVKNDFRVIAEVGSKDDHKNMSISEWKHEVKLFLEAGCDYVITEGRDSGTAGIYQKDGAVKQGFIREITNAVDHKKIIFEAPTPKQQMHFIKEVGANVNLGNVKLNDVLVLEAQRCGLRSETFFMEDENANYLNPTPSN